MLLLVPAECTLVSFGFRTFDLELFNTFYHGMLIMVSNVVDAIAITEICVVQIIQRSQKILSNVFNRIIFETNIPNLILCLSVGLLKFSLKDSI